MKISIITATYNSSNTILDCITSVNNQTYKNIEHIIIDGGSKDKTIEIINNLPNRVEILISEPDKGIYDAMNKGITLASGAIVGILNSDDMYIDQLSLEKVMGIFNTSKIDCVFGDLFYVKKDNTDKVTRHWKTYEYKQGAFNKGWHPAHPSFFVKKEVYEKYGLFDLSFKLAADFELMLRFLERNHISSFYLPCPLVKMRLGGATNKNFINIFNQNLECYRAFKKNKLKASYLYPLYRLLPKLKQYFK